MAVESKVGRKFTSYGGGQEQSATEEKGEEIRVITTGHQGAPTVREEQILKTRGIGESQKLLTHEVGTLHGFSMGRFPCRSVCEQVVEESLGLAKIGKKAQLGGGCVCWSLGWGQ